MVSTKYVEVEVRCERHPDGLSFAPIRSRFGRHSKSGASAPLESLPLQEIPPDRLGKETPQVKTELLVSLELECGLAIIAIGEKRIDGYDQRVPLGGGAAVARKPNTSALAANYTSLALVGVCPS